MPVDRSLAIQVEGVTKRFPKMKRYREMLLHPFRREEITALRGVDLRVARGELFGLLGPNGAGKTTLIKILCTLVHPNEGRAWVNGYDTVSQSWRIRCSIGYVISEERSFYWRLTGRQNLEFFATLYNLERIQARKRIRWVLRLLGLESAADKMFKDYSTGMRQKLAIARGLLTDPAIIFMDEPTRSLDPLAAQHLRDFVIEEIVARQGRTVFFSTHNLQEAQLCRRIAILDRGKIVLCDSPARIKEQYSTPRYHLRLGYRHPGELPRLLAAFPQVRRFRRLKEADCWELELEPERGPISELIGSLVRAGVEVHGCSLQQVSLEEVFCRLTCSEDDG